MTQQLSRRTFHQVATSGVAFGLAALQTESSKAKIIGANDRIGCAFVGVANRGRQLLTAFLKCDKMDIVGISDVDSVTLADSRQKYAPGVRSEKDFRAFLDDPNVDALVFATPDHWHAYQTIESCKAGKDVYVEKPLSATVREGRLMVEAARKYGRVVQTGIHRRSSPLYTKLAADSLDSKIGRVTVARTGYTSNMFPKGMGRETPMSPPETLDWDMWLGPKPDRPYQNNIAPYKFRWWISYCSQIANQGVHLIDATRWVLGEKAPSAVCAMGGKFVVDDDRTIPDTMEATFQFDSGRLLTFSHFESSSNPIMATDDKYNALGVVEFRGTQGTLYASDNRYIIKPERGGQFQDRAPRMKEDVYTLDGKADGNVDLTASHAQNFLDCMRSREVPRCDVEEGHRSTSMSLIANISLALERRLKWNGEKEEFVGDAEANTLLDYPHRDPWKLTI